MRYFQSQPTVSSRSADGCVLEHVEMTPSGIPEFFCMFSKLSNSLVPGNLFRDFSCNWCS